jgi:signal transduction histidine kinase
VTRPARSTGDTVTATVAPERMRSIEPEGPRQARLSVLVGPGEGHVHDLGDSAVIGRAPDADICVPDAAVSRRHLRLTRLAPDVFGLEDLQSCNGTFVDGRRIEQAEIRSGARIQVGPRCLLLFSMPDKLEQAMLEAQQIALVGKVAAGLNHDLNNLLCALMADASYLRELPLGMTIGHLDVQEVLGDMRAATERGAELTQRMATFALGAAAYDEERSFSAVASDVLRLVRETFPRNIDVRGHVQHGLMVQAREAPLRELIMHPLLNARDAMPDGGTLRVQATLRRAEELQDAPLLRAEHYVVYEVRDSGCGMPPEVARRAFEPFFTTKELQVGSGLGLAIVRKVAQDLGGRVGLSSEPGHGTVLTVVLPAKNAVAPDDQAPPSDNGGGRRGALERKTVDEQSALGQNMGRGRRVLVADDDEALLRVIGRALRRGGFEVVAVGDGQEALERFSADPGGYAAAILDHQMPRMDGVQCMAAVREQRADFPVVLISGATDAMGYGTRDAEPTVVLRKPIDLVTLLEGVEHALHPPRNPR